MTRRFPQPLWQAPFRPFFLLGALYAPLALILVPVIANVTSGDGSPDSWFSHWSAGSAALPAWHMHELVFGYSVAILCGFLLTALPSWAGTPEIGGARLACLCGVWLAARIGYLAGGLVPAVLTMVIDLAFLPCLVGLLLPGLLVAGNRRYLCVLPILTWLFLSNVAVYANAVGWGPEGLAGGGRAGVYGLMIMFNLVGGFLTPVFTETALRDRGWQGNVSFVPVLEWTAAGSMVVFALSNVFMPGSQLAAAAAFLAAAVNVARMARWRSFSVIRVPLVAAMHVAFAWFIAALIVHGAAGPGWTEPDQVLGLHLFTVGALGLMKLALMIRITLRHTGRPPHPSRAMMAVLGVMALAPVMRILGDFYPGLLAVSALAWGLPFLGYLALCGRYLIRRSLPR